jgi:nicotinamide mononucleotide transporter
MKAVPAVIGLAGLPRGEVLLAAVLGSGLLLAVATGWLPLPWTEVAGFVTGALCVWLVTRQHLGNWPLGLANNVFFFVLFLQTRLYADMGLQVVYFAMGVWGWWHWLRGGTDRTPLQISRTTPVEWLAIFLMVPLATAGLRKLLIHYQGSAPFWDSLTTILSLAAQYLLCRKRLENWWIWIVADLIYIPLYLSRGLVLTAVLYAVFLVLCLLGWYRWCMAAKSSFPARP